MKKFNILILTSIMSIGCSTASTIQKVSASNSEFDDAIFDGETSVINDEVSDSDAYRIFHQAATGFVSIQSIRQSAEKRDNNFCNNKGKTMQALRERTSTPPHILGNFPRIEIIFVCTANMASTKATNGPNKYQQLKTLKTLLDDGAITTEEYNIEKSKLLSK